MDLSLTGLLSRGLTPLSFDYLYLGLTNASAFSPADMMPMVPCVNTAMMVQPLISIAVIGGVDGAGGAAGVSRDGQADRCGVQSGLRVLLFLSKEMLYPGSRFRMAAGLQETYIR